MPKLTALGSIMIITAALPCNARSSQASEPSIRLHLMGGRPVVDGVFVNGKGPLRFLIDTGAQTNQLHATIAHKLGLEPAFQVEMATMAGSVHMAGGRVADVSLGSATASNQEFLFSQLDGVHALSTDIQGVLGQEFLSRFDYLLDFANRRLIFGAAVPAGGSRADFETIDGRPAIATSEGKLVLDSGTDTTILFRAASSALAGRIRTASGSSSVSTLPSLRLLIGGREYRPARAVSVPGSLQAEDGELPAGLFRALFVCNSGAYVIVDPAVGLSRPDEVKN